MVRNRMISRRRSVGLCQGSVKTMRPNSVVIDQVLHGYDRGHKELASSINLDSHSRSVMLVMSDSMAALEMKEGQSYLVSYPLRSAAKHVLARTWSAGGGYRPGSVWTHSIILDYQALTLISDLMELRVLFRHPEDGVSHDFISPIIFRSERTKKINIVDDLRAMSALTQIYGKSSRSNIVLPYASGEKNELLALSLWRQMWPSLRREFTFVTCPLDVNTGVDAACNLRFSKRESEFYNMENSVVHEGHLALLDDLPYPGTTNLRAFLGRYVIESKHPKELAPDLAQLQSEVKGAPIGLRLTQVCKLAHDAHLSRLMRDAFMAELKVAMSAKDIINIICVFRNESIDVGSGGILPSDMSFSDEELKFALFSVMNSLEGSIGRIVFCELVEISNIGVLVEIVDDHNRLFMMQLRPELVVVKEFWPASDESRAKVIGEIFGKARINAQELFEVFGLDIGPKTIIAIQSVSPELPEFGVVRLLSRGSEEVKKYLARWVISAPGFLSKISKNAFEVTPAVVEQLARAQIDSGKNIESFEAWSNLLLNPVFSELDYRLSGAVIIVGFIVGVSEGGRNKLLLCKFYDPLQRLIKKQISNQDEIYLRTKLAYFPGGRALNSLVASNALKSLSPSLYFNPQIFNISQVPENLIEIAKEVEARYGLDALEKALSSGNVVDSARRVVELHVKNALSKKKIWTWW